MSKKDNPEAKGEAPKPGPTPQRLSIDPEHLEGALGRIVCAGKPERKPKARGSRKRK